MRFSESLQLTVKSRVQDLEPVHIYLIEEVVEEWKNTHKAGSTMQNNNNVRFERMVQDNFNSDAVMGSRKFRRLLGFMSRDLRNQVAWGMLPANRNFPVEV